jgi:hypothetical protein
MPQLFISHVEEDKAIAVEIAGALERSGFSAWYYERDSVPGVAYLDQVCEAIEQCQAFILIISRDSLGSHQVDVEVIRAFETRRPFVPLLNGISHVEFQSRKPGWRLALGAATSVAIPTAGVSAILDRVEIGVKRLGLHPASNPSRAETPAPVSRAVPEPPDDGVECTLFAPPVLAPGESGRVHVWLHTSAQAENVAQLSTDFDPMVQPRGSRVLETKLSPGARVRITLEIGKLQVRSLATELTWHGGPDAIVYQVRVPEDISSSTEVGQALLVQGGAPLAALKFKMQLKSAEGTETREPEAAARFRKAFLCYSHRDRAEVLRRAQMLPTLGMVFEMDSLSLRSGENWDESLHRMIDEADVFLLFWSYSASQSEFVKKEWQYALQSRGDGFIRPIALESPMPLPPEELAHLHFQPGLAYVL